MDKITEQTFRFMRQFNCVCRRMTKANILIDVGDARRPGAAKGIDLNLSRWYGVWTLHKAAGSYSPFAMMAVGKKLRAHSVLDDLEISANFSCEGVLDAFSQGFINAPSYRDVWLERGYTVRDRSYYQSVYFHLGRAFLQKYCGISLPFELPEPFLGQFRKLS